MTLEGAQPNMLFVVGRGRSGTTLLARLLTQHSRITFAPEGMFVSGLRRRYAAGLANRVAVAAFVRDLLAERRMRTWHLDEARLHARLCARLPGSSYPGACREVYRSYVEDTLGRAPSTWLGDKNPHHALFVPELLRLFPDARFIHLTRDPRDNVRSYLGVDFDLGSPVALAYRWRRYNELVLDAAQSCPERFVRTRFEDLVVDPRRELARICSFLGTPFEPSMLAPAPAGPRFAPDVQPGWYQAPLGAIDVACARGAGALPAELRAAVDRLCAGLAERLGYEGCLGSAGARDLRGSVGLALGVGSVLAERALLDAAPVPLRAGLINGYRRALGRV